MIRRRAPQTPRFITARFASKCAETGQYVAKGETCLYYPGRPGKVYAMTSETVRHYREAMEDERFYKAQNASFFNH